MRIMVFDVAAESGGALSVLHDYYNEYKEDKKNEYIFVVSLPKLEETSKLKVLMFPKIKKSWWHRLYFDYFIAPKLIIKYNVDKVLSLQNIIIPRTKAYQCIFLHNALPFSEYKFHFLKNRKLWIYQNIIGKKIFKSIRKANSVIVQTEWMKKKIIEKLNIKENKIEIKKPKIDIVVKNHFKETEKSKSTFFYPSSAEAFKNHEVIVKACLKLKEEGITDYRVIFTLCGDENKNIASIYNYVKEKKLPIEFIGMLRREQVFSQFTKSVLLFPSYIETVGLPLIEAVKHNTIIIVSRCEYSIEILKKYDRASFFDPFNQDQLASIMLRVMKKQK